MNILIAPNAFKNSLAADDVAEAIDMGLKQSPLNSTNTCFPIGDGGDGTAALLLKYLGGDAVLAPAHDALGRKIATSFGLTKDHSTAIIELADASGLRLLQKNEYDPLHATTFGTGELIQLALTKKVKKIVLCIGGSATVDGGMGILQALGIKLKDEKGNELTDGPASLIHLGDIDLSKVNKNIYNTDLIILCDVDNSLLGENGSAAVFGPQKGASKEQVQQLELGLTNLRNIVLSKTGKDMATPKHGGAAGGVAACLHTFFNAQLVTGIDYFLDTTHFNKALLNADLLITGEGSIDAQTLQGKGPYGVARRAKEKGIPVIGVAGKVPFEPDTELQKYFDVLLPISDKLQDIETATKMTHENLVKTGKMIGDLLSK